jgi:hypothetical protein
MSGEYFHHYISRKMFQSSVLWGHNRYSGTPVDDHLIGPMAGRVIVKKEDRVYLDPAG